MSMATFFYHQGMVITGVPYSSQELLNMSEMTGGTPYGASTVAGPKGERKPSANELAIARAQGRHAAGQGERNPGEHQQTIAHIVEHQVEQDEHQQQRGRHDQNGFACRSCEPPWRRVVVVNSGQRRQ